MSDEGAGVLMVPAIVVFYVAIVLLEARINNLHSINRWPTPAPTLINFSLNRNVEAFGFIFFASPWKSGDAFAWSLFYLARFSFAAFVGLAIFLMTNRH